MKMDKIPTFWDGEMGCGALVARGLALKIEVGKFYFLAYPYFGH